MYGWKDSISNLNKISIIYVTKCGGGSHAKCPFFFGQNKRAVVVYRKNKITPLFFFFLYRDTHSIPDAVIEKYVIRV